MAGQIINRGERTWLVRVPLGVNENGTRKYHNKTIHGNRRDAERYMRKVYNEMEIGKIVEPSSELLSTYLERWLDTVVKSRVSVKTLQSYREITLAYITPHLGGVTLSKLTSEQIQESYNALTDRRLSPRTVRYVHSILRSALNQAVKWGLVQHNPVCLVDLPKQPKKEMVALTPAQAAQFMGAIVYSKWKPLFSLLLASGMRPGEALGLKWGDIDFDSGRVQIQRALSRTKAGWSLVEPKTSRSRRSVPLPASVIDDLREHQALAMSVAHKDKEFTDHGLVFANDKGEPPCVRSINNRHFKPILLASNLPIIRIYDLRHTCATLLLSAGINPKIVAERLGHASITLTLDTYSHVLPDMQTAATDKLEAMLFGESAAKA